MGRNTTRPSLEESERTEVTFKVADAVRVIEAKVSDRKDEARNDIDSKIYVKLLETGKLSKAREFAEERGIEPDERKDLSASVIGSLVAKGEHQLAAKMVIDVGHDEDSLEDALSDPDVEDKITARVENELVEEEIGGPQLRGE